MKPIGDMHVMSNFMVSMFRDEQGQDLIEYALLVGLIAILSTASLKLTGDKISTIFSTLANALPQ